MPAAAAAGRSVSEEAAPPGLNSFLEEANMHPTIDRLRAAGLRGGIFAMLLSCPLPGLAADGRGLLEARDPAEGPESREGRLPTWASATLVGEVLVKSDRLGRLAVVVDEALGGRISRGAATRMFLLTPATPLDDRIDVRLALASVLFRGDALSVSTP